LKFGNNLKGIVMLKGKMQISFIIIMYLQLKMANEGTKSKGKISGIKWVIFGLLLLSSHSFI
jgi:hypothetical protein